VSQDEDVLHPVPRAVLNEGPVVRPPRVGRTQLELGLRFAPTGDDGLFGHAGDELLPETAFLISAGAPGLRSTHSRWVSRPCPTPPPQPDATAAARPSASSPPARERRGRVESVWSAMGLSSGPTEGSLDEALQQRPGFLVGHARLGEVVLFLERPERPRCLRAFLAVLGTGSYFARFRARWTFSVNWSKATGSALPAPSSGASTSGFGSDLGSGLVSGLVSGLAPAAGPGGAAGLCATGVAGGFGAAGASGTGTAFGAGGAEATCAGAENRRARSSIFAV